MTPHGRLLFLGFLLVLRLCADRALFGWRTLSGLWPVPALLWALGACILTAPVLLLLWRLTGPVLDYRHGPWWWGQVGFDRKCLSFIFMFAGEDIEETFN